jgi:hypothetical protein
MGLYHRFKNGTYSYNGGDGTYAAITFGEGHLVATLFDHESDRSPFRFDYQGEFEVTRFFQGMPISYSPLAKKCLGFWYREHRGKDVPYITTAFWDDGEYLAAAEAWAQVWEHGGHVLEYQLMDDPEEALPRWQQACGLSPELIDLARSLLRRKMARPGVGLILEPDEALLLNAVAEEGPEGYEGEPMKWLLKAAAQMETDGNPFEEGCKALASIGIHLP